MDAPPPPPPPHGANAHGRSGGLPDGKYDIFVIPPSSAGSGFLYLPSLQTQRNSFLAGVACTATVFFIWSILVPAVKDWFRNLTNGSGSGIFVLAIAIGVMGWAWGKTQAEGPGTAGAGRGTFPGGQTGSGAGSAGFNTAPGGPGSQSRPSWQRSTPQANTKAGTTNAKTSWEKAREETRKKEEERRKTDELKKKREELEKERQKQREKDAKEREERERKAKEEREHKAKEATKTKENSPPKRPPFPTAHTEQEDDAYSFRPYDRPKKPVHKANSAASMYSESSYAASQTTAKTTPPPETRGPYTTKDPDKIIIKAVYMFNNAFMRTPVSQLISGQGAVTDGLILRITTEGLFIDDDVRGVAQREWDIKAWTMKLAEVWCPRLKPLPVPQTQTPLTKPTFSPFASPANAAARHFGLYSLSQMDSTSFMTELIGACVPSCCVGASFTSTAAQRGTTPSTISPASTLDTLQNPLPHRFFPHQPQEKRIPTNSTLRRPDKQSTELSGLHILRASIRDQEGKKYVFVLGQSEGWKVAVGLQRLRRGTQVRALGVSGLPANEAKVLVDGLGWG